MIRVTVYILFILFLTYFFTEDRWARQSLGRLPPCWRIHGDEEIFSRMCLDWINFT